MESKILLEVEMMLNQVREEKGRPFDVEQVTMSCVANVSLNMMFGHRFDHFDPDYQQLISDMYDLSADFSVFLELFPVLRFLPYFKKAVRRHVLFGKKVLDAVKKNIATCIEVCIIVLLCSSQQYVTQYFTANWQSKY